MGKINVNDMSTPFFIRSPYEIHPLGVWKFV